MTVTFTASSRRSAVPRLFSRLSVVAPAGTSKPWGMRSGKVTWVLLDLYGTDQHPRIWPDPTRFIPDRFLEKTPSPFELVPQGAGDPAPHIAALVKT